MKSISKEEIEALSLENGDKIRMISVCCCGDVHRNTGVYIESFEDNSGKITIHYHKISRPGRLTKTNIIKLEKI